MVVCLIFNVLDTWFNCGQYDWCTIIFEVVLSHGSIHNL